MVTLHYLYLNLYSQVIPLFHLKCLRLLNNGCVCWTTDLQGTEECCSVRCRNFSLLVNIITYYLSHTQGLNVILLITIPCTGAFTVSASTTRTWSFWKKLRRDTRTSNLLVYRDLVPQNHIYVKVFNCFLTPNTTKPEENKQWISILYQYIISVQCLFQSIFHKQYHNPETCANLLIQFLQGFSVWFPYEWA